MSASRTGVSPAAANTPEYNATCGNVASFTAQEI